MGSMIGPQASLASPRELPDSNPRVTPAPGGLTVEWSAPPPKIGEGPDGRSVVDIPGFSNLNQPGAPRMPYASVLVALPRGANPTVEIMASSETTQPLKAPLVLGEQPGGVQLDSQGQVLGGAFIPALQEKVFTLKPVVLERLGILRGVHLARLSFYPALPEGDKLRLTSYLKVQVNYNATLQLNLPATRSADPLLAILESAVINPEHLQIASPDSSAYLAGFADLQLANTPTVAIEVSETGLTSITYEQLEVFGLNFSSGSYPTLTRDGKTIASILQGGNQDAVFEPGEELLFFADPRFSRWTSSDIYLLSNEDTDGLRMESRAADGGNTAGIPWVESLFEENKIYTPECFCAPIPPGRDGDRWVWKNLLYTEPLPGKDPIPITKEFLFHLTSIDFSQDPTLTIWLIGQTDLYPSPDHKIDIAVNGHNLGSRKWDGKNTYQAEFTITASISILNEGENTLTITLPGMDGIPLDGIWLDAISIRHARTISIAADESLLFSGENSPKEYTFSVLSGTSFSAYDVTNPDQPVLLTGIPAGATSITISDPLEFNSPNHDYWLSPKTMVKQADNLRLLRQSLLSADFTGADYLIISPAEFIPFLSGLVDLRKSQGLKVVIEDVQAIYDAYAGGRPLPSAIQAFLEESYFTWSPTPLYVLLVGDGTHDPRGYLPLSSATFIPPFLADVDPWMGETAADNRYVSVDGEDALPDMIIGRLPANDIAELDIMVSKIVQYETNPFQSPWQHQAVFVADDPDTGGDFHSLTEILIGKFPANPFSAQRLYFQTPDPNLTVEEIEAIKAEFRKQLQQVWDAGNGLMMFTGHSSIHQWAHEIFFHLDDVSGLENGQKLPVVLEMTCFTGSFQIPAFPTLDEALLRHPGGGAVAVWGSTGLGIATGHHWLAEGFMKTIYQDGISDIGSATLAGKLNLLSVGSHLDLIDTFNLLGDPATNLERSYQIYMPLNQK